MSESRAPAGFFSRLQLRRKLALLVLGPLVAVSLFLMWFLPRQLESSTNKWATRRAVGIAQVMARAVQAGVVFDDADSVTRYLEWLSATAEVVSASVARADGSLLAQWQREGGERFKVGALTVPTDPVEVRVEAFGNALRVTAAVVSADTPGAAPKILGCVSAVVSLEELLREKADQRIVVLLVCGLIMVLGTLVGSWLGGRVAKPIGGLTSVTFAVVQSGDLTQPIRVESSDETGALAGSFSQMMQRLRSVVLRLKETESNLGSVSQRLASTARTVASGAEVVQHKSGETALLIERNDAMLREGEASVMTLRRNAGNVFSSINNMATANTSVATSMQSLTSSADSSAAAIEEMTAASVQMAQRIKEFDASLNEVSTAVSEIYTSTTQIETHAETTARLAETVTENATAGVSTVEKTVSGVEEIRRLSETTVDAIKRLSGRLASIDEIVAMIRTVAEQTNLLALNAAIIAAQSGEHGRGFAVVADEIKNLASRTRGSTSDIADLIATIQQESEQVTVAVRQGLHSAEDGVRLGHETREALTLIVQSAREAMEMTQSIARATVQQSQESQRVTLAVRRIATHIQEISEASTAHAKTSEQVMASTKAMRELGRQVRQATDAQAQSSGRIVEAVNQINTLISTLSEGQSQQSDASRQVLRAAQAIAEVASKESASVESLTDAVAALQREASTLSETLGAFRV